VKRKKGAAAAGGFACDRAPDQAREEGGKEKNREVSSGEEDRGKRSETDPDQEEYKKRGRIILSKRLGPISAGAKKKKKGQKVVFLFLLRKRIRGRDVKNVRST